MDGDSPGPKKPGRGRGGKKVPAVETEKAHESEMTIELEHVLGMTVYSNSALTCHPASGLVAYPAGCVLVLLDSVKNKQVATLHTPRKSVTAAKFSPDGRYVLTGESGLQPAVRVWDLVRKSEVACLRGHSVGIASLSFTPRMREIIVVGDAHDMMISVWAWPSKVMRALNKFADEIYSMTIAEDSSFFVTVGNRHVKFYNMDNLRNYTNQLENPCPIPLPTRCGIMDSLKDNCFCDVVCGRGCSSFYIFVIAISGVLCQINRHRLLERWVNVNMQKACCLDADDKCVFVGGAQGTVRMFQALDLQIILTLPRPHNLGLDIAQVTQPYTTELSDEDSESERDSSVQYPETRALTFDPVHENLTVVYDDHSLYIWGRDQAVSEDGVRCFKKRYSSMYHRGCVWDLTTYPVTLETECEEGSAGGALPPGALISVSSDGTLRAWDVSAKICEESVLKRNCLSAECLKIVYCNKMDVAKTNQSKTRKQSKTRESAVTPLKRHGKQCFSVVGVCPDGMDIATGNRQGRVCIYDANTMITKATMLAHEAEVTALRYSITSKHKILASGSRDRMIHVMDASRDYQLLTTLDDHSSTITAINFTHISRCLLMVTSSLDMSVLVRAYLDTNRFTFRPVRAIVEKKSVMDFTIHPWSGLMALACQDRLVRIYSIMSSVENNSFRGCPSCGGQLIKIQVDPSGQFLLTACSNKTINLLQFSTGVMLRTINGHAENITGVKFSHNMKHIISFSVDGCIFLWRLPQSVTYAVKKEMAEMGRLTRGMVLNERWKKSRLMEVVRLSQPKPLMEMRSETSLDLKKSSREGVPPVDVIEDQKLSTDGMQNIELVSAFNKNGLCTTFDGATSEAWLNACYERRRIFKLEAQSIQKILAMMRLVTDAMEKDLANSDWLICPNANTSHEAVNRIKGANQIEGTLLAGPNMVQMVVSAPFYHQLDAPELHCSYELTTPSQNPPSVAPDAGDSLEPLGELGSGPEGGEDLELPEDLTSQQERLLQQLSKIPVRNKCSSNNSTPRSTETLTIQLSAESSLCQCVGAFFNHLSKLNYSSAVGHINEALEQRQRQPRSLLFRPAPVCHPHTRPSAPAELQHTEIPEVDVGIKQDLSENAEQPVDARSVVCVRGGGRNLKQKAWRRVPNTGCNLRVNVRDGIESNVGKWSGGNVYRLRIHRLWMAEG